MRCVRSKPETAKQAPNRQAWPRGCAQTQHLKARSFDLEVTPWAPSRLTSCIFHPGPEEAYERLRSTLCPARAPFHHLAAPGSTRKPLLHTRSIPRPEASTWRRCSGRRPDLPPASSIQVTRRHMSPFDRPSAPHAHPSTTSPRRNRPASLQCAGLAFISRARTD